MAQIPIIGPGYNGRSLNLDSSRMVNFYAELVKGGKNVAALIGTPGTLLFSDAGLVIRGMHVFNGLIYLVAGGHLYSLNNAGALSASLLTLTTTAGRVGMADNGKTPTGGSQLVITDGTNVYVLNVDTMATTTVALTANTITFMNGYFVADTGGLNFQISNLYDGTTWNALNASTADAYPDDLLAVYNSHMELWLIGQYSTEVWYQTGLSSPLFDRISGGVLEFGTPARWSAVEAMNGMFWLGTQKSQENNIQIVGFVRNSGYNAQVISPPAINFQISQMTIVSDCFGYSYTDGGHTFIVWTFPSENRTFVYDATTDLWHERSTYSGDPYTIGRHIGNCYANFNGKHYIGDWQSGNIFEMSTRYYDDNGIPIVSFRTTEHINDKDDYNHFTVHRLWVDAETGVGDNIVVDPQAELSWSDDGGHTWSNPYQAPLGKIGEYRTRLLWRRLGHTRNRVWKISISDSVKRVLIGAGMQASKGGN